MKPLPQFRSHLPPLTNSYPTVMESPLRMHRQMGFLACRIGLGLPLVTQETGIMGGAIFIICGEIAAFLVISGGVKMLRFCNQCAVFYPKKVYISYSDLKD